MTICLDSYAEKLGLFNVDPGPCLNPKGEYITNSKTGEPEFIPSIWYYDEQGCPRLHRCGTCSCRSCVVINGRIIACAIHLAHPHCWFAATQVGVSHSEIMCRMRTFHRAARSIDAAFCSAWAAERNPRGTGNHIHGFAHTELNNKKELGRIFREGFLSAEFGERSEFEILAYPVDVPFFAYPMDDIADDHSLESYRALNYAGDRPSLIHNSRAFFRDGEGGQILTMNEAKKVSFDRYRASILADVKSSQTF